MAPRGSRTHRRPAQPRRAAIGTSPQEIDAGARQGLGPAVWRMVDRSGITPNVITILGFLGICAASWLALTCHITIAAAKFRAYRAAATGPQTYPPPSAETVNREITTPLRGSG